MLTYLYTVGQFNLQQSIIFCKINVYLQRGWAVFPVSLPQIQVNRSRRLSEDQICGSAGLIRWRCCSLNAIFLFPGAHLSMQNIGPQRLPARLLCVPVTPLLDADPKCRSFVSTVGSSCRRASAAARFIAVVACIQIHVASISTQKKRPSSRSRIKIPTKTPTPPNNREYFWHGRSPAHMWTVLLVSWKQRVLGQRQHI